MAVAYLGYIRGTYANSAGAQVNLTTRAVGELALVWISRSASNPPTTVPSGWTLLEQPITGVYSSFLYYKVLEASDKTTLTWLWSYSAGTLAQAVLYSGHDSIAPVESSSSFAETASSNTLSAGSVTSNQLMLVFFGCVHYTVSLTYTPPSGYVERLDWGHTSPAKWQEIADTNGAWGGGTSSPVATLSSTYSTKMGALVAIKEEGTGGAPTASVFGSMNALGRRLMA
jgi:hypothetical protein